MEKSEESVARYYDTAIFEAELVRLTRDSPAERGITLRWLERLAPDSSEIAEIGVGGGLYSECLARKGCRVYLVDVSARLLDAAAKRLRAAGLGASIAGASHESATRLKSLATRAFDAALLLGPLYHLCLPDERRQAVAEAARILKPGGLLFAAGINRQSYLRDLLRESPHTVVERRAFHQQYLLDGNLDPEHAPPIGYAHLTTCAEFRALFADSFEEVALVGVESFSTAWQTRLNDLPSLEVEAWLDLIEATGQSAEGSGALGSLSICGPAASVGLTIASYNSNRMNTTHNTILITGGGSGIGRGLAEAFHALGNHVVIAGRRRQVLDATTAANPGMTSLMLDIEDPANIRSFAAEVGTRYPGLNVLINNAGIMRVEKLQAQQQNLADAQSIIAINLLGPIRLTAALLPLLQKQPRSAVMNVSSGLAFVPMALTATYCATKAAIHSYTQSLRYQLQGSTTEVLELIPPYVATDLLDGASDPRAMPLEKFIAEVMEILKTQPESAEICVENVKPLRFAAGSGRYDSISQGLNAAFGNAPKLTNYKPAGSSNT